VAGRWKGVRVEGGWLVEGGACRVAGRWRVAVRWKWEGEGWLVVCLYLLYYRVFRLCNILFYLQFLLKIIGTAFTRSPILEH